MQLLLFCRCETHIDAGHLIDCPVSRLKTEPKDKTTRDGRTRFEFECWNFLMDLMFGQWPIMNRLIEPLSGYDCKANVVSNWIVACRLWGCLPHSHNSQKRAHHTPLTRRKRPVKINWPSQLKNFDHKNFYLADRKLDFPVFVLPQ